jgi:hypothetical protein
MYRAQPFPESDPFRQFQGPCTFATGLYRRHVYVQNSVFDGFIVVVEPSIAVCTAGAEVEYIVFTKQ